jgi:PKD domain
VIKGDIARGALVAAGLVLAVLLSLALAPEALAAWTAPLEISSAALTASQPQIALDGAGNATAVWVGGSGIHREIDVATRPVGGTWSAPVTIVSEIWECHDPQLGVDSSGAAVVAADCDFADTLRVVYRAAGGSWGVSTEVPGSSGAAEPSAAIDDSGNAIVVWDDESANRVYSSYRPVSGIAAGTWGAAQDVSPAAEKALQPDVTLSPGGGAFAVWLNESSPGVWKVEGGTRSSVAPNSWTASPRVLTSPAATPVATEPVVTTNRKYLFSVWAFEGTSHWELRSAWGNSCLGCFWGEGFHGVTDGLTDVEAPQVGVDEHGHAVAVWRNFKNPPGTWGVQAASTGFINGTWSAPQDLSPVAVQGFTGAPGPQVAVDLAGATTAVWGGTEGKVYAASGAAGSALGAAAPISGATATERDPQVASDEGGDAVAVWTAVPSSLRRVAFAVNDVTPPVFSAVDVPGAADPGAAVAMSATATDAWSAPVAIAWDFGDGATASGDAVSHAYSTPGAKTVTATATDGVGNVASETRQLVIAEPGGGGGGGGGGASSRVKLRVTVPKQTWKQIGKAKAIKLRCSLDRAGSCRAKASVAKGVARRLGLKAGKKAKAVSVGKGSVKVPRAGATEVLLVRLTAKARKAIAKATSKVKVALAVTGSAGGFEPSSLRRSLSIRRR